MRTRRPPPPFRRLTVDRVEQLSVRMVRVTVTGEELRGLVVDQPASSVRLVVPSAGAADLVIPEWTGNEFLLPDGERPALRTFTPRRLDPAVPELDLEIVIHGNGVVSDWAAHAEEGDEVAVSGTARGYDIDPGADQFVLLGDESALPALGQLLEAIPAAASVLAHVEVMDLAARLPLPDHPAAVVEWHELPEGETPGNSLVAAARRIESSPGLRVWAAGEAAAMQRIRTHLFEEVGLTRTEVTVRGYWKAR